MSNDSIGKTVVVALGVCVFWSLLVSTAAVTLKPLQDRNKRLEKIKNILVAGSLYEKGMAVEEVFRKKIETRVIELKTGEFIPEEDQVGMLNPATYNIRKTAEDSELGRRIPDKKDKAGIKRMPKFVPVHYVMDGNEIDKIILPVYGKGLWSTMYGFLALNRDLRTIEGFTIYEHGETPGLGGEVDNPRWKAQWKGKVAFDRDGRLRIEVLKGKVDPTSDKARYQIDGLSGSTLTTRGVHNMVRFWLGDEGYGPFLNSMREEAVK